MGKLSEDMEKAEKEELKKKKMFLLGIRDQKIWEDFIELIPATQTPTSKINDLIEQFVFDIKLAERKYLGDKNDSKN